MKYLLTICIVNYNSSEFVINTLYCLEKVAKNKYKVIIRDNNSKLSDYINLKKSIRDYSNIELFRVENFDLRGAMAHGTAINELVSKIDTEYGVILDADCTFLYKNWDEILINELDDIHPIIGTQGPTGPKSLKIKDFPLMFAILFNTKILKQLKVDFRPNNDPDPFKYKDTGELLREAYINNGYKGKLINTKITRYYKSGPFRSVICSEYYLNGKKEIFASHFGRGSTLGRSKYLKGPKRYFYFIPIIGSFLLKQKGKKEKKKWIKICKEIVFSLQK